MVRQQVQDEYSPARQFSRQDEYSPARQFSRQDEYSPARQFSRQGEYSQARQFSGHTREPEPGSSTGSLEVTANRWKIFVGMYI